MDRNRGFASDAKAITKNGALSHTPNNSDENGPGSRLSDAGRLNVTSYQLFWIESNNSTVAQLIFYWTGFWSAMMGYPSYDIPIFFR